MKGSKGLPKLIITGILVAAAIILIQRLSVDKAPEAKAKVAQFVTVPAGSSSSSQPVEDVVVSVLSGHLPSVAYVETCQEMCLFEIIFEAEAHEDCGEAIPITLTKFFLILFQAIISPNAP